MAAIQGRKSELWAISGTGTTFTTEACDQYSGNTYHITDTAKRQWDPGASVAVYDNAVLQTSGYVIYGAVGQIEFDSAPTTPVTVSGKYLTTAEITLCQGFDLSLESDVYDITSLGDTTRKYIGSGLEKWSGSVERLAEDDTWSDRT